MKKIVASVLILIMILSIVACGKGKKEEKAEAIHIPNALKSYVGKDYSIAYSDFEKAGFENIKLEVIKDIDGSSDLEDGAIESITVDGEDNFAEDKDCSEDTLVFIAYHTYVDYHVKIHIDFHGNLLFDKYDVNVSLGLKDIDLDHGESGDLETDISMGEHTISFTKLEDGEEDFDVTGEIDLDVKSDLEAAYEISCDNDKIKVSQIYVDYEEELEEGQVKVSKSAEEYKDGSENYQNVISELKEMGFTNIKEEALYDIVFVVTDDGELESVTIDGKDDYARGDIFYSDVEVLVTFHTLEENDPERATEASTEEEVEESTESIITQNNNEKFKHILKVKNPADSSVEEFADSHIGDTVYFKGCIALMMRHNNMKTRFDIMMKPGDYKSAGKGAQFVFHDVNYYDMNVSGSDTVAEGMTFKIKGEIVGYNYEENSIELEPISLEYID